MILADPTTREEWLKARTQGIGGSDAGCIVGANPWKSARQLWKEKTGADKPDDICRMSVHNYTVLSVCLFLFDGVIKKVCGEFTCGNAALIKTPDDFIIFTLFVNLYDADIVFGLVLYVHIELAAACNGEIFICKIFYGDTDALPFALVG